MLFGPASEVLRVRRFGVRMSAGRVAGTRSDGGEGGGGGVINVVLCTPNIETSSIIHGAYMVRTSHISAGSNEVLLSFCHLSLGAESSPSFGQRGKRRKSVRANT